VAKLLSDSKMNMNWFAIYTKPRWEKKVAGSIEKKGFEVYCPLNKVRRKWSDRFKVVEEPLFKSYVFVKLDLADQTRIRLTEGVVNFIYWQGSPAIVRNVEIEMIKKFLNQSKDVQIGPADLYEGMNVRVRNG